MDVDAVIEIELTVAKSNKEKGIPFNFIDEKWSKILYLTYKEIVANGAEPKDYYLYPAKIKDTNENEIYEMRFISEKLERTEKGDYPDRKEFSILIDPVNIKVLDFIIADKEQW